MVVVPSYYYLANSNLKIEGDLYQYEKLIDRAESITESQGSSTSFSSRAERWSFSLEIFESYNLLEVFFGSGFDYLSKMNRKFGYESSSKEDYPHNILISHMLFSGVFGFLMLLVLYLQVFKIFLSNSSYLFNLFILFLVTTLFLMTSGNSLFSSKIYLVIFVILFAYHRIRKRVRCNGA